MLGATPASLRCGGAVSARTFTPAEANSALVEVRPAAERLVAVCRRLRELEREQGELVTAIGGNGGGYAASDLVRARGEHGSLADATQACVGRLVELGVEVKDLDTGLLDFPAVRDGEQVELCWRVGEEDVRYWHRVGEGFAGRKPIDWGDG